MIYESVEIEREEKVEERKTNRKSQIRMFVNLY